MNLLWCDIPWNKAPRTGPRHIWRTYTLWPLFGRKKNTDSNAVGLMISLASFIFFPATARDLQSSTLFILLCMTGTISETWHQCDMNVVYSDSKTDLKLWCDYLKNSSYSRVPKMFLVDWRLCVANYYHITPTDYPSTTRGMTVGPPVAVNINFCGYHRFLSISFVWSIWAQYTSDNLSGQQFLFVS